VERDKFQKQGALSAFYFILVVAFVLMIRFIARQQGILINGAIGLQVIVGALTTGVAAAGTANVRDCLPGITETSNSLPSQIGAAVAVFGGISTILASYLAKIRGSGEPEFSTIRAREVTSYLRDLEAFVLDHGSYFRDSCFIYCL